MGVPKFYRWISERYPCLSEVVKEYQIPKFDNLYLDMNGIIHVCSHPNDDDPHFRISEEEIFKDIFHYIEVLFRMIQPAKVFYMAVDGVAPRAKMNQQRGRRFRSAREAKENEKRALEKGEVLPTEARFDSNCITPGTEFMTKLDAQLQYFIKSKVSSDNLWQNCSIIYSSHKTPGEGEHKIMEYIRYTRSQPGYNPNTRHCLYGLDADLIMLGLTSHEPHFSLLREEIKFGRKKGSNEKRMSTPEQITFHLLHLSLMREYINLEFHELHDTLPFPYDLESIIDDWVLMGFLVGNDFIPHLPGLHINKDSLSLLYKMYKQVLPTLDGYLNKHGHLHLGRLEKFMTKLTEFDEEAFHDLSDNLKYLAGKRSAAKADERANQLEPFSFDESDALGNLHALDERLEDGPITQKDVEETLARLDLGQHLNDFSEEDRGSSVASEDDDELFREEFRQHKRDYYITKMLFKDVTPEVLRDQASNYVLGLQWILHYYYNGICSWSWYYPYHYAPYISDVRDFANMDLSFDIGAPFLPFEQLLAVLPPLSANFLPKPYQQLMLSQSSPLKEFYPIDFDTDLNGKLQNWEAVVLIPFINECQLLEAMKPCTDELTSTEKERNTHGPIFIYRFTPHSLGELKAPSFFPSIALNHASVKLVWREEWEIDPSEMFKGLLPGALSAVLYTGFPTLKYIEHSFRRESCAVRIFQQDSRGESFILEVKPQPVIMQDLLKRVLGNPVYVPWPHLMEAKVVAISSQKSRFYLLGADDDPPRHEALDERQAAFWNTQSDELKSTYMKRWGIDVGEMDFIIYAKQLSGRTYIAGPGGKMTLKKSWSELDQPYPLQLAVWDVEAFHQNLTKYRTVEEFFSPGTKVFMLGNPNYGCMGEVVEYDPEYKDRVPVSLVVPVEPRFQTIFSEMQEHIEPYFTASECAVRLSISSQLFARLTGAIFMAKALELNPFMEAESATNKLNIGLNLKSTKRSEEAVGFSRRDLSTNHWLYSGRCVESMKEYMSKFPEVFEFLSRNPSRNDIFQDELFPTNYETRVSELAQWLKTAPFAQVERQKWGTTLLSPGTVEEIVKEVEFAASQRARSVKLNIKPHLLFKPNSMQGNTPPDPSVSYAMFDRIINVREGFSVPLGAIGTIVGIQRETDEGPKVHKKALSLSEKLFTILFDEPFLNGLSLIGPNSARRCYRLMSAHMINISHGQRLIRNQEVNVLSRIQIPAVPNNPTPAMPLSHVPTTRFYTPPPERGLQHNFDARKNTPSRGTSSPKVATTDLYPVPLPTSASHTNCSVEEPKLEEAPPEPPKPSQLPKPLLFTSTSCDKPSLTQNTNSFIGQDPVQEIKSERDVKVVIHGDFYENWNSIRTEGLRLFHGQYIPCLSYVPTPTRGGDASRSYDLHIYLNIAKLLRDGIRLFQLQKGQILCSTNQNGLVPPYYFEKVIDVASERSIFSNPQTFKDVPKYVAAPSYQRDNPRGRGMGFRAPSQPSPFGQLFDNIWSQVQNANTLDRGSSEKPESRGPRKEIPLNELFNLSSGMGEGSPPKCNPAVYSAPLPLTPPLNLMPHHTDVHSYSHLSHSNNDAPSIPSYNNQQAVLISPRINNGNLTSHQNSGRQFTAFDPRTHLSNSCGDKTSFSKCHNNKAKFVPTQVSRKQTPRKLFSSGLQSNQVPNPTKGVSSSTSSEVGDRRSGSTMCHPGPQSFKETKPKRKHRNRLAANFDLVKPVRPDNG